MRTLNINAKKRILLMNRGSENFQKCGFSLNLYEQKEFTMTLF